MSSKPIVPKPQGILKKTSVSTPPKENKVVEQYNKVMTRVTDLVTELESSDINALSKNSAQAANATNDYKKKYTELLNYFMFLLKNLETSDEIEIQLRYLFAFLQRFDYVKKMLIDQVSAKELRTIKLHKLLRSENIDQQILASEFIFFLKHIKVTSKDGKSQSRPFENYSEYVMSSQKMGKSHTKKAKDTYQKFEFLFEGGNYTFAYIDNHDFILHPHLRKINNPLKRDSIVSNGSSTNTNNNSVILVNNQSSLDQDNSTAEALAVFHDHMESDISRRQSSKNGTLKIVEFGFDLEELRFNMKKVTETGTVKTNNNNDLVVVPPPVTNNSVVIIEEIVQPEPAPRAIKPVVAVPVPATSATPSSNNEGMDTNNSTTSSSTTINNIINTTTLTNSSSITNKTIVDVKESAIINTVQRKSEIEDKLMEELARKQKEIKKAAAATTTTTAPQKRVAFHDEKTEVGTTTNQQKNHNLEQRISSAALVTPNNNSSTNKNQATQKQTTIARMNFYSIASQRLGDTNTTNATTTAVTPVVDPNTAVVTTPTSPTSSPTPVDPTPAAVIVPASPTPPSPTPVVTPVDPTPAPTPVAVVVPISPTPSPTPVVVPTPTPAPVDPSTTDTGDDQLSILIASVVQRLQELSAGFTDATQTLAKNWYNKKTDLEKYRTGLLDKAHQSTRAISRRISANSMQMLQIVTNGANIDEQANNVWSQNMQDLSQITISGSSAFSDDDVSVLNQKEEDTRHAEYMWKEYVELQNQFTAIQLTQSLAKVQENIKNSADFMSNGHGRNKEHQVLVESLQNKINDISDKLNMVDLDVIHSKQMMVSSITYIAGLASMLETISASKMIENKQ